MRMQVEAQALKGLLNMLLLSVLAERPQHAYAVRDALRQGGGGQFRVAESAVYSALHRLEHLGLVSSSLSLVDGRTRRTYSITPAGQDQLDVDWKAWEEFSTVIAKLVTGGRPTLE